MFLNSRGGYSGVTAMSLSLANKQCWVLTHPRSKKACCYVPRTENLLLKRGCTVVTSDWKPCLTANLSCAAAFSLQVLKWCIDLVDTLLYILILGTYTKFVRENKILTLRVYFPRLCSSAGRRFAPSTRCKCSREGRASLVNVQEFFFNAQLFPLDTDNCTARDPWTWRWREETRVIPYASELDTAAQPQAGQHVGPARSSLSDAWGITLDSCLQCQVHGFLEVKLSVSRVEKSEIQKFPWTWTREALSWTFATRKITIRLLQHNWFVSTKWIWWNTL